MIPDPPTVETPIEKPIAEGGAGQPARDAHHGPSRAGHHICYVVDCDNQVVAHGLCRRHYDAIRKGSRTGTRRAKKPDATLPPPLVVACPDDLIPLVTELVENDTRSIFMLLWRAIGDWHLQGLLEESA